jgi:hypothetical protein
MTAPSATLSLGKRAGGSNFSNMLMDNFRLFNKVLSSDERSNLYYKDEVPSDSSCVIQLSFNNNVTDSSGNGNDGTAAGTPAYSSTTRFSPRVAI